MKNQKNPIKGISGILFFTLFSYCTVLCGMVPLLEIAPRTSWSEMNTYGDNLAGGWEYTAQGAPEGYAKGFLLIIGQDGNYQVQVQNGAGTFIGENVAVKKNTISFTLMIEGDQVKVSLTADGSKISGKSSSSEGDYVISGTKTLSAG